MKIKSERDFWAGLLFVVIGVAFVFAASDHAMGPACPEGAACAASLAARLAHFAAQPGPGYFPIGLGGVLAVLGAIVLFKSLVIESVGDEPIGALGWRPLGFVIAAVVLFAALLRPAGLVATVACTVIVASLANDDVRWRQVFVNAAVCALVAWLCFVRAWPLGLSPWPGFAR